MKKVSIVIPAYNLENYIVESIQSCIHQTYSNIEIIVVNDGSIDATSNKVQELCKFDNRIVLIDKENEGVSKARNVALAVSTGDYVIFLDGDDQLARNAVEVLVENRGERDKWLIACGRYLVTQKNKKKEIVCTTSGVPATELNRREALLEIASGKYNFQSACYKLFELKLIKENNILFNENYSHGEDGLFVYEYLRIIDGVKYITDPLWYIYVRPMSASRSGYSKKMLTCIDAVQSMLEMCNDDEVDIKNRIRYLLVDRCETLIKSAVRSCDKNNIADIKILRRIMKEHKLSLTGAPLIKKEMYIRYLYMPYSLLRVSCIAEDWARKTTKNLLYKVKN